MLVYGKDAGMTGCAACKYIKSIPEKIRRTENGGRRRTKKKTIVYSVYTVYVYTVYINIRNPTFLLLCRNSASDWSLSSGDRIVG